MTALRLVFVFCVAGGLALFGLALWVGDNRIWWDTVALGAVSGILWSEAHVVYRRAKKRRLYG